LSNTKKAAAPKPAESVPELAESLKDKWGDPKPFRAKDLHYLAEYANIIAETGDNIENLTQLVLASIKRADEVLALLTAPLAEAYNVSTTQIEEAESTSFFALLFGWLGKDNAAFLASILFSPPSAKDSEKTENEPLQTVDETTPES